jgi:hypothetical protein
MNVEPGTLNALSAGAKSCRYYSIRTVSETMGSFRSAEAAIAWATGPARENGRVTSHFMVASYNGGCGLCPDCIARWRTEEAL